MHGDRYFERVVIIAVVIGVAVCRVLFAFGGVDGLCVVGGVIAVGVIVVIRGGVGVVGVCGLF